MVNGMVMLRMALAALLSGLVAGLLLAAIPVLIFAAPYFAAPGGPGLVRIAMLLGAVALAGLIVASVPAFVAGATLWALQGRYQGARRPATWAGAGAGVGALFWVLLVTLISGHVEFGEARMRLLACCLAAGAGAALAFRAAMRATAGSPVDAG